MATEVIHQLTEREARKLVAEINASAEDLGSKLIRLCREMGWAALGYTSFRECCKAEFANNSWALGKSPSWVCRQIQAVETKAVLPIGTENIPESVVRELNKLPADQRADAWKDITERLGDHPTAAQVHDEVDMMLPPDEDPRESPTMHEGASEDEDEPESEEAEEDAGDESVPHKEPFGEQLWLVVTRFWTNQYPEVPPVTVGDYLEEMRDRVLRGER